MIRTHLLVLRYSSQLTPCYWLLCLSVLISGIFLTSCGGGGSSSGGGGGNVQNYYVSVSPASVMVNATTSPKVTVTVQGANGFTGTVTGSLSGLPAGVTATPSTFTIANSGSQDIQFSLSGATQRGTTTVTISTTGGSQSRTAQFTLDVEPGAPGVALSPQSSAISLDPGTQQQVQLQIVGTGGYYGQVSGTVTGLPSGVTAYPSSFTAYTGNMESIRFSADSTATASGTATITITSGSYSATHQVNINLITTPDFQLSTGTNNVYVLYQNSKGVFSVKATPYNNFNQPIAMTVSGLPVGVTASPATFTLQPGQTQDVTLTSTFSAAATNSAKIIVTGTGGGITKELDLSFSVWVPAISMSVQPSTVSVPAGSMAYFEVQALNTDMSPLGNMTLSFNNVPAGITLSPASVTLSGRGGVQSILVQASKSAANGTIGITATYGPIQQKGTVGVTVGAADSFQPVPLSTSDGFVRTDSVTPYQYFPPPNYLVYHAATNRFFSTDAYLNRLNVIDAGTRTLIASLDIPTAFGLDQAPDGSVLYVGTMLGDLYVVDPVRLQITKRYPSTSISPYGFRANAVYAMASGKLLLEQYFLVPGYSYVDGNGPLALWDPATNDISVFDGPNPISGAPFTDPNLPYKASCLQKVQDVKLTNNRTRVLLSPVQTSEGSSYLCSMDPEAGTWNWSVEISHGNFGAFTAFALNSDGSTLYAFDGYDVDVFDAATMALKRSFPVTAAQSLLSYPAMFLSRDDRTLFITDATSTGILDAYDVATGNLTGWMPQVNLAASGSYSASAPIYQAIDANGVAAGVMTSEGVGFADSRAIHALPIGSRFMQTQLSLPYGPLGGGTYESWLPSIVGLSAPTPLGSIYFGNNAATDLGNNSFSGATLFASTPAGNAPGPVDVRTFSTDGGSQLLPEGFSYGPWVLESPTTYSTAEGGSTASLYGYGFGPAVWTGQTYVAPPPDLQVTVGGNNATVTDFGQNPYKDNPYYSYFTAPPMPKTSLHFTIPAAPAGTTANITVSNSTGGSTGSSRLSYLPKVRQYSVDGVLVDGLYDSKRDVYYLTDSNQVRVFSATQGTWLQSIFIPMPVGAYAQQRLWALALSPDGSKLAVSDAGALAIYVINPDQPSHIQSFPLGTQLSLEPITQVPAGLAITNSGDVYFATFDLDGDGGSGYMYHLNTATGKFNEVPGTTFNVYLPTEGPDPDSRLVLSSDGTRIFFNDLGILGYIDTATGQFHTTSNDLSYIGQLNYELTLAPNQTRLFAAGFMLDSNLNGLGLQELDLAQALDATYVYGAAMSSDGSLLFQPGLQFVDVFDGRTGSFRARIGLPMQLSPNYRALVSNNKDNQFLAITGDLGNGIAILDFNSIPEPAPRSYFSNAPPMAVRSFSRVSAATAANASKFRKSLTRAPAVKRQTGALVRKLAGAGGISVK